MPTCLYSAYLPPSKNVDPHICPPPGFGQLCLSEDQLNIFLTPAQSDTLFFNSTFIDFKEKWRVPDKVCVLGLIRVGWPNLIRGIGCISLTSRVYLAHQGVLGVVYSILLTRVLLQAGFSVS